MWRYFYLLLLFSTPILTNAQNENFFDTASIVADKIEIDANGNLKAKGNIKIRHNNNILRASELFYSRRTDELTVLGPLSLTDSSGNQTIADNAIFKNDFREAVLLATKVILKNQLEISAEKLVSSVDEDSNFSKVTATSCRSCKKEKLFWVIKANRVRHDEKLKTIYFYDSFIEILGLPVFYTPYLSIPDPSVKRGLGFLAPEFLSNSRLDFGMKLPFFIPLTKLCSTPVTHTHFTEDILLVKRCFFVQMI